VSSPCGVLGGSRRQGRKHGRLVHWFRLSTPGSWGPLAALLLVPRQVAKAQAARERVRVLVESKLEYADSRDMSALCRGSWSRREQNTPGSTFTVAHGPAGGRGGGGGSQPRPGARAAKPKEGAPKPA
jgi:hypothetical protein